MEGAGDLFGREEVTDLKDPTSESREEIDLLEEEYDLDVIAKSKLTFPYGCSITDLGSSLIWGGLGCAPSISHLSERFTSQVIVFWALALFLIF